MEDFKNFKYLAIIFLFLIFFIVLSKISDMREENRQFEGAIEKIEYSEKKIPTVTIKGVSFSLNTSWRFNERMAVGDFLIKEKKSMTYKLIKHKTGEIILSK